MKTIKIENIEYSYLISKIDKQEGISIELKEIKPNKNIIFKYEALLNQIIQDIKPLAICESIEEMINSLNDIFLKDKIMIEKREEKYIMIIEIFALGKIKKYEIELKKIETDDQKKDLLNRIENIENKFELIQQEINKLKLQSNIILNKEDKKKIIKEIKEELNINEYLKFGNLLCTLCYCNRFIVQAYPVVSEIPSSQSENNEDENSHKVKDFI